MHTPGHRPEHTAFALIDTARGAEPWAVLTGDTLFVGDIARPDLAVDKEEGARGDLPLAARAGCSRLPDSVRGLAGPPRRLALRRPGDGHEGLLDDRLRARAQRAAARATDEDALRRARDSARSARSRRTSRRSSRSTAGRCWRDGVERQPLTPRQVERSAAAGALVVDVRTDLQFDEAHIPGASATRPSRAGFGTKLAWVADRGARDRARRPRRRGRASRAAGLAGAVGIAQHRRLPRRRDDELARGAARPTARSRGSTSPRCTSAERDAAPGARRARARRVGRGPHPRLGRSRPTTTSTASPTASTRAGPSPSSARPASAAPSRPRCSRASARAR